MRRASARLRARTTRLMIARRCPMNDPPPLKWSALRYGFRAKEDHDAEEETQARGDCCEAAPGGCAGVAGAERYRSGTLDWGYGGHVLPLAPGVWRAQERSGQATEGSRD